MAGAPASPQQIQASLPGRRPGAKQSRAGRMAPCLAPLSRNGVCSRAPWRWPRYKGGGLYSGCGQLFEDARKAAGAPAVVRDAHESCKGAQEILFKRTTVSADPGSERAQTIDFSRATSAGGVFAGPTVGADPGSERAQTIDISRATSAGTSAGGVFARSTASPTIGALNRTVHGVKTSYVYLLVSCMYGCPRPRVAAHTVAHGTAAPRKAHSLKVQTLRRTTVYRLFGTYHKPHTV